MKSNTILFRFKHTGSYPDQGKCCRSDRVGAYSENLPIIRTVSIIDSELPVRHVSPVDYSQVNNKYTCSHQPAKFSTERSLKIWSRNLMKILSSHKNINLPLRAI